MTNFVYDNTTLNFPKSDFAPLPVGADATKYVRSSDWNTTNQALIDVKSVFRGAKWYGLEEQVSDPAPTGVANYLFNQGGALHFVRTSPAEVYRAVLEDLSTNQIEIGNGTDFKFTTSFGTRLGTAATEKLAFWGATPVVQPTVTGSRAGNAALASLLTQLQTIGLLIDSSTA